MKQKSIQAVVVVLVLAVFYVGYSMKTKKSKSNSRGWLVEAYANETLSGSPRIFEDSKGPNLEFDLKGPFEGVDSGHFSLRWSSCLSLESPSSIKFLLSSDDGALLSIDDKTSIDNWGVHGLVDKTTTVELPAGVHLLQVKYFQHDGSYAIHLRASRDGGPLGNLPEGLMVKPTEDNGHITCL